MSICKLSQFAAALAVACVTVSPVTVLAADYTWTGGAENNVLTDGDNWSPKLPTTSNLADVGIIDGLPSGTVLSMGEDYTAPKLKFSNTSSLQLDLAGHTLTFGNNNNFAWSFSDCELTVTDSVGGGSNVFMQNAASSLGVNSKLIYDGVSHTRVPAPKFPEDRSAELIFKNGTTAVFGQIDDGHLGDYSRIVVDNATLSWENNFSRWPTSVTKGWTIVAQNNGTVTGNNYCYLGSSDVNDPVRFVATSGGKISMPSVQNRFYWQNGGFEAYCTNATIQLNGGYNNGSYSSFGKFVCESGEMKGLLSVRANNEIRFSGTCTALPSLLFAADAQDNDILFTNVTCASFPIGDLKTLGQGTNNVIRIANSALSLNAYNTPLNLFTDCGSSPSENSVVEFSGKKAALVSYNQSGNKSINIGQNTTAVAAADRPHLRFRIPEGGFDDTPIRSEIKNAISWDFNPIIEVVPDGVRYGDEPTYHPLVGFGEGGAGAGWTGARPPSTASNLDNLNEISADYLPHGAELVVMDGTRKSVGVLLPERIILSAEYASELGTVSAKLSLNREPDAEIHMVYGWENGGEDVDGWENDEVVESLEVGPVPGFGTSFLHLRFYTVNGDGTVSWSSAFAASDDPKLSEPTVDVGGNYVKISGVLEDAGIVSTAADIALAVAKADEEFGEPVTVKVGVRAGEAFDRAVSGLASATAYKFRLTATNEHGVSTTVEGTFTTTGGSGATPGMMTVTASGYTGGTTLEGFPLLVRLSAERLAALGVTGWPDDAGSVAFYDADDNELPCEVDTWDPQGEMLFWVKVPSLVGTTTQVTLKWGEGVSRKLPATDVWTDYALVHHLDDASAETLDSTANGFDGQPTAEAKDCAIAEGVVGQSYFKNGGALEIDDYSSLHLGGVFTATGWFYFDQRTAYESQFAKKQDWNKGDGWKVNMQNSNTQFFGAGSGDKTFNNVYFSDSVVGRWVHLTLVYNGTTLVIYENGVQLASKGIAAAAENTYKLSVGDAVKGRVDEIRIRKDAVSADWSLADYATQHDTDFCSFTLVSNPRPDDYGEDPVVNWNGALSVDSTATISLPYDAPWGGDAAALVDVHMVWGFAEDALDHDVTVATGTLGAGVGLLEDAKPGETYYVQLYATSGGKTSERTEVRSVQIPTSAVIGDCVSTSTATDYTITGSVTPGVGLTRVWLRYSFNSDAMDRSVLICEKRVGDNPGFSITLAPTQEGDTLHWRIETENDWESPTWGEMHYTDQTDIASQLLTSSTAVTWTWTADETAPWQDAANWSAAGKTGFPNGAKATAAFAPDGGSATAELRDDVTLAALSVADGTATVKGGGHAMTVAKISLTGDATTQTTLALDGVTVPKSLPRPTFTTGDAPAGIWLKGGTTVTFNEEGEFKVGTRWRASGEGTVLTFAGNTVRWSSGRTSNWSWLAEDGAKIVGSGYMHLGSKDDTRDVRLVALNGGSITCGGGNNRTAWDAGGIVVAATNAGTVAFGAANDGAVDGAPGFTSHSRFLVHNGNVTGNINLASNNVVTVTGDGTGTSSLGSLRFAAYGCGNRVSIVGGTANVAALAVMRGTDNEVLVRDAVVVNDTTPTFASATNCALVVDDATVTNTANAYELSGQVGAPGSGFVFRGTTPRYVVTGVRSGTLAYLGRGEETDGAISYAFEPTGDGFVEPPLQFSAGNAGVYLYEYLPIRVDLKRYTRTSKYLMPLIGVVDGAWWRPHPTAEQIESHLPAGALPKGAHLEWSGGTLCVRLPSMGGFAVIVK